MSERPQQRTEPGNRKSQHADVPVWCDDACCCEPEPRWQALAEAEGGFTGNVPSTDEARSPRTAEHST